MRRGSSGSIRLSYGPTAGKSGIEKRSQPVVDNVDGQPGYARDGKPVVFFLVRRAT